MPARSSAVLAAAAAVPAVVFGVVFGVLLLGDDPCGPAGAASVSVDPASIPDSGVEGFEHEQLVNAAHVIAAGRDLGLGVRDQTIGVMVAMGESGLRVLDHGDRAGPDSRGLFQQRANGAWGSYQDRMDPYRSASMFFEALRGVDGRDGMEPTIVAHRVQRNADPFHYEPWWDDAVAVVEAIGGVDPGLTTGSGGGAACVAGPVVAGRVGPGGWAQPAAGPVTSGFGMRRDPVSGSFTRLHAGLDFDGGGDGGPIWAAHDGIVTRTWASESGGWSIEIDHGAGISTRYLHMWSSGVLVRAGQTVTAGQQIGRVGSAGHSTGPHLHFEVRVDGTPVDPQAFADQLGFSFE